MADDRFVVDSRYRAHKKNVLVIQKVFAAFISQPTYIHDHILLVRILGCLKLQHNHHSAQLWYLDDAPGINDGSGPSYVFKAFKTNFVTSFRLKCATSL